MQKTGVYFVGICPVQKKRRLCSGGNLGPKMFSVVRALGTLSRPSVHVFMVKFRAVKSRQGSVRGKLPAFCRRRGASRAVFVRKLWRSNRLGERHVLGLSSCAPERATGSTGDRDASVRKLTPFLKTFWRRAPLPLPLPLPIFIHLFFLKKRG